MNEISGSNIQDENKDEESTTIRHKVIIIGAGVSGLSAADYLLKKGINDVIVLESRNRIGGRVIAINVGGRQLELGANWIHGVLGNPMFEIASANGLIPIVQPSHPHTVLATLEDGSKLSFSVLQEMFDVYSLFLKRCDEYFLLHYQPPEGVRSVGQHLRLELSLYLQQLPAHQRLHRRLVFEYLMRRETCITGVGSLDEVDLLEFGSYTELPGGNILLPSGYSSILKPLTKDIPPLIILKGHPVTVVRWNRTGKVEEALGEAEQIESSSVLVQEEAKEVTGEENCDTSVIVDNVESVELVTESHTSGSMSSREDGTLPHKVEIVCENGVVAYADTVICTLPLGVLKLNACSIFDPPLPETKIDAINRLSFGTVDKIFLEYDRPFLPPELNELILLWSSSDSHANMEDRWFRKIFSFTKLSDTLLLGWISGEEAKFMETLPFDVVAEKCTEILRQFLADPFIPKPKQCICTSWWSQPYTRGSYTSIAVGGSQNDILTLGAPLWADNDQKLPSVVFAGEHCHPTFYSTVHGAFLSGREAARFLCSLPAMRPSSEMSGEQSASGSSGPLNEPVTMTVEGTADISSWLRSLNLS